MKFNRHFTTKDVHPFEEVNWELFNCQIRDKKGKIIFNQEGVEFPDFWEQLSVDITVEKYFSGAMGSKNRETSLKQTLVRISDWYTEKGKKDEYFDTEEDAKIFKEELIYILLHQYAVFNSPVLFNVGVQKDPQVSACFILSAEDTMDSISENMKIEMDIFRKGSGVGTNHSKLRSSREKVSVGGYAMGPLPPMRISDKIAGATKSGGKTRRAALMKELNIDHGDVEDFITQKAEIERAAKVLIKAGWSSDFDDPKGAYSILGLQNFNESVSIFNSFMKAYKKDEEWALIRRKESSFPGRQDSKSTSQGLFIKDEDNNWYLDKSLEVKGSIQDAYFEVIKWVPAKTLWNLICESAWECADPGLQFYDTINEWNTCKSDGDITGSNPCSEYFFLEDTSCNLASHNLLSYLGNKGFDFDSYMYVTRLFIVAMDISISNASYPAKKIGNKTKLYRTLGLGYSNVGALLMSLGIPYDSDKGRYLIASLTALLLSESYLTSSLLASQLGPFERYEENKEYVNIVLEKHRKKIEELLQKLNTSSYGDSIEKMSVSLLNLAYTRFPINFPIRNAQTVVLAPTGTISFWLNAETTGIEPMLGLVVYKKLVGGGFISLPSSVVERSLESLGYKEEEIQLILSYMLQNKCMKVGPLKVEHLKIFETSFGPSNLLSPLAHVKMMAECQPFISGGISKTVNIPNNATVEDISDIYFKAWEMGLKSIAVYRDDCKLSQPLNTEKDSSIISNGRPKPIRKKLPKKGPGHRHEFQIGPQKGFLNFGVYPDSKEIGDMFAEISKGGSTLNGFMNTIAILISHMLQYGIPIEEVIETMKNLQFEPSGFTDNSDIRTASSIPDYIARYMELLSLELSQNKEKEEVKVRENSQSNGPPCLICGRLTEKSGSCYRCINCGESTGCG